MASSHRLCVRWIWHIKREERERKIKEEREREGHGAAWRASIGGGRGRDAQYTRKETKDDVPGATTHPPTLRPSWFIHSDRQPDIVSSSSSSSSKLLVV